MARSDSFPGTIDRPNGTWRWRVMLDGERPTYRLPRDGDKELPPEPDHDNVADFARREYKRLQRDARKGRSRALTFSELLERFEDDYVPGLSERSQRIYKDAVARFELFYVTEGDDPLARDMDAGDVDAYLSWPRWHKPDGTKRTDQEDSSRATPSRRTVASSPGLLEGGRLGPPGGQPRAPD